MTEYYFETTAGVKIKILPISMIDLELAQSAVKREFAERGEKTTPPVYSVDVLGGEIEYHDHTETTIQDATPEDKEAWDRYIDTIKRMGDEIQRRTELVIMEGICVELPKDNAWAERRKRLFGDEIPDDEEKKKLKYLNTVLLKTPADKVNILIEVQKLSLTGSGEEVIEAWENLFRSQVEVEGRAGAKALKALSKEKKGMVLQPTVHGSVGSKGEGNDDAPTTATSRRRPGRNNSRRKHSG